MTASPLVQVQFSSDPGIWHDPSGGIDIVAGDTVSIRLADTLGVGSWYMEVMGVDEITATHPVLINVSTNPNDNGRVVSPTSIVSFTAAVGTGRAYVLKSSVNGPSLSANFGIFIRTSGGFRVGAIGERFEADPIFGWTGTLNNFIRNGGSSVRAVVIKDLTGFGDLSTANSDGVVLSPGDRVLLTRQVSFYSDGIYTFSGASLDPTSDVIDGGSEVFVNEGEVFGGRDFQQLTPGTGVGYGSQFWQSVVGPHITPPLTTYPGSGGSVTWQTLDNVPGPPIDGYDLILVTDSVATKSTGGSIQRERGAVTYHLASGVLTLSDDSRSLTAATYFQQVVNFNSVDLQVGQQATATGDFTFRVRAWFEYVRTI